MSTAKVPIIDKSDPDLRLDDIPDINWVELKKDNKPYFFNYDLKQALWDAPDEYTNWKNKELDKFLLKTEWRKLREKKKDGDIYYLNVETKETSLTKPPIIKEYDAYLTDLVRVRLNYRITKGSLPPSVGKVSDSEVAEAKAKAEARAAELKNKKKTSAEMRGVSGIDEKEKKTIISPLSMDALLKYNKLQQKSVQSKPKPSTIASNERDEDDDQNVSVDSEKIQTVVGGSVVGIAKVVNDRFDPNSPGVMSPQGRVVESVQAVNNSNNKEEYKQSVNVQEHNEDKEVGNRNPDEAAAEAAATAASSSAPKALGPKLTTSQLYDLYQRLDINGDGELDMQEFLAVGKKLNFTDETLIVKAFRSADTSNSGKLDTEEFITAYESLYYGTVTDDGDDNDIIFVRALRYGFDKTSTSWVMQSYTGNLNEITCFEDHLSNTSTPFTGNLESIVQLMNIDGRNNKLSGSRLLWWVDVAVSDVLPSSINKIIQGFGLPQNIDTCFYNEILPQEKDSRVRIGEGKIKIDSVQQNVKSLNFFVQSLWLKNLPVVQETGRWTENLPGAILKSAAKYIYSRISLFLDYGRVVDEERRVALIRVNSLASNFVELNELPESELNSFDISIDNMGENIDGPLTSKLIRRKDALPLPSLTLRHDEPGFLLTKQDLEQRDPIFVFGNCSVHLLDIGSGPNTLITFHKIDDEADVQNNPTPNSIFESLKFSTQQFGVWTPEQQAKAGTVGRILHGVLQRIYLSIKLQGVVSNHGDIVDSSAYLAVIILSLVHDFNLDSLGLLEMWIQNIQVGLDDMAVTKHIFHIRECTKIIKEMKNYIEPFQNVIHEFLDNQEANTSQVTKGMARRATLLQTLQTNKQQKTESSGGGGGGGGLPSSLGTSKEAWDSFITSKKDASDIAQKYSQDNKSSKLSIESLEPFMSVQAKDLIGILSGGDKQLELQGCDFWVKRLDHFLDDLDRLKDIYNEKLDEKRNFWGFLLTVVSLYQWPIGALTGYFGMNFDNMIELFTPNTPGGLMGEGITFEWVLIGIIYAAIAIISIQQEIIYMAS